MSGVDPVRGETASAMAPRSDSVSNILRFPSGNGETTHRSAQLHFFVRPGNPAVIQLPRLGGAGYLAGWLELRCVCQSSGPSRLIIEVPHQKNGSALQRF